MEEQKPDEIARHQDENVAQIQGIEEKTDELSQYPEQGPFSEADIDTPQTGDQGPTGNVSCPQEDTPSDETASPSLEDVLQFQLNQAQQQLWEMTEERNNILAKHTACVRRSVVLGMERNSAKKESSIFRQQRNVLQNRLDILEDQGVDIGKPRNDLEAEARLARRQYREKVRFEGLAGAKIFPALNINSDCAPSTVLETELLNAMDETEGEVLVSLLSPKARSDIDSLFEESDETSSQRSPKNTSARTKHRDEQGQDAKPATAHQYYNIDMDVDMVYGDENSEDLIDWTPDDEFDPRSYPPAPVQASFTPVNPAQSRETRAPLPSHHSPSVPTTQSNPAPAQPQFETTTTHHSEALNEPWDDLARPLSPRTLPTTSLDSLRILFTPREDDTSEQYAEKLNALETLAQEAYNMTLVRCDEAKSCEEQLKSAVTSLEETRGELELSRRDLATRTGERNGARHRSASLVDELKEQEMKELQLREELRLGREEDPLADKLFIELSALRKRCEELEEESMLFAGLNHTYEEIDKEKAIAERDLALVRRRLEETERMVAEHRARITEFTEQRAELTAQLDAAKKELDECKSSKAKANTTKVKELQEELEMHKSISNETNDTQTELNQMLNTELGASNKELWKTQEDLQTQLKKSKDCEEELKRLTTELAATKADLLRCEEVNSNDPSTSQSRIQELTTSLKEATTTLTLAQTQTRNAVAAAEQARDEATFNRRALEAETAMVFELRQISAENIRELVNVREERDGALHDVTRLIEELYTAAEDARRESEEATEARREGQEVWDENQVLTGRFVEAERRAGEYGRQVLECEERVEGLKKLVQTLRENVDRLEDAVPDPPVVKEEEASPMSPVSSLSSLSPTASLSPTSPLSPGMFVQQEEIEELEMSGNEEDSVVPAERRSARRTRNPAPVYVDPESPPVSSTVPKKRVNKRKRVDGDEDVQPGRKRK